MATISTGATYENGVLRPDGPLELKEHQRVDITIRETESRPSPPYSEREAAALDAELDELSAASDHVPPLPDDFSRADLYDDHD